MTLLSKFRDLSSAERHLCCDALLRVALARLTIWAMPLEKARIWTNRPRFATNPASAPQIVWAIQVASRFVPRSTCLVKALATQVLLSRRAMPSRLVIGVALGTEGEFLSHAWVEYDGEIIIGAINTTSFQPLITVDAP